MSETSPSESPADRDGRFARLGRALGEREAKHSQQLDEARGRAEKLRTRVEAALGDFHRAARVAGSPHLEIGLSEIRLDDKHVRAFEFELFRGRHRAIVTAKSRGDVTLVGPFKKGKTEGPCRSFAPESTRELCAALDDLLESFLEEAVTP